MIYSNYMVLFYRVVIVLLCRVGPLVFAHGSNAHVEYGQREGLVRFVQGHWKIAVAVLQLFRRNTLALGLDVFKIHRRRRFQPWLNQGFPVSLTRF